ncbi:sigma 54-interacting transcriptional regulator [Longimicrobium sp.]|uniref:sigma 54-interacting transcriptional regulator n=1 Tax=Longimicrobium sp. TaxID=2029185 RepID=UPI002D17713C|nr:sigma 54-interacting transcriptional regulator [Longimicrobium sp.]HSU13775.1 sigma 54-interacting transcriptional regulator [Longimicrobium sp.]
MRRARAAPAPERDAASGDPPVSLLKVAKRTLEMIAGRASLPDILANLCAAVDAQDPGIISTVLLADADGTRLWPAAGPRVPAAWVRALSPVPIGPAMGSCGTAAFRKERVVIPDIATDPLWPDASPEQSRRAALAHGLRASWSQPVLSKDGDVLGTFAMYYGAPRAPDSREIQLIEDAAQIAVIAIEGERSRAALERAVAELGNSERRLRAILDAIPTQVWRVRVDGVADYLNQRWHEYTGIPRGEAYRPAAAADVARAIVHPDDAPAAQARWRSEVAPAARPTGYEVRLRRHDGEYRWFMVRVEPVLDEVGSVVEWYGTNTDIEELKRAQHRLRQDEQELRRITDAIAQTILVLAPDGTALYANRAVLDYTGLGMEEVMAPDFRARTFHPEDVARLRDERHQALLRGVPFENEQRIRRADGEYRWFLIRFRPFHDDRGRLVHWYATGTDIDDRKRAEEALRNENLALREDIDRVSMAEEIVGGSAALRQVLAQVAKVAPVDSTVLISGETGTGKELVARAIHGRSRRAGRAFIRVNCAAIPPSLIASELFGHEKGAFTGALQRRIGRFEAADGGTIFLDEVGEFPAETQVALLRVLQERELERLGSSRPVRVDVRVLAATNRDLEAAVASGAFRRDLYYRLNVFPIRIPPLRERVDDIPVLAGYLVERFARRAGKRIRQVAKTTMALFQAYDWPGNVRELQNVIERAVVLCEGDTFSIDESWLMRPPDRPSTPSVRLAATLEDREKELIEAALAECGGRVSGPSGAAARLGIPRQTLDSKIRTLRIDKLRFRPR